MCNDPAGALQSLYNFFRYRHEQRVEAEQVLRNANIPVNQWGSEPLASHNTLDYDACSPQSIIQWDAFRGAIPWRLLCQFFHYMDDKGLCAPTQ
jgi:hypothetical protein